MISKPKILIIGGFLSLILKFYYVGLIKIFSTNSTHCTGCMTSDFWVYIYAHEHVVAINLTYLAVSHL